MNLRTFLELGRTSNLPTVWTNVLCGAALASGDGYSVDSAAAIALTAIAGSALYLGGMLLNDAFDAEWDRAHQKPRPIVLGNASSREVFATGLLLLGLGVALSLVTLALGASMLGVMACIATVAASRSICSLTEPGMVFSWRKITF